MQTSSEIRDVLLQVIEEVKPKSDSTSNLQSSSILRTTAERLGIGRDLKQEQAILTEFSRLFSTGYLGWGHNLDNDGPPFCHVTSQGEAALERVSRDPANPEGFKRYLADNADISAISESYLNEALDCYVNGQHKAAAVMLGAASERLALDVRDAVLAKIKREKGAVRPDLEDWRIKKVLGALKHYLDQHKQDLGATLRDSYESHWPAFTQEIRVARNEAGHPNNIAPVTYEAVHANFLVFPIVAELSTELRGWASKKP